MAGFFEESVKLAVATIVIVIHLDKTASLINVDTPEGFHIVQPVVLDFVFCNSNKKLIVEWNDEIGVSVVMVCRLSTDTSVYADSSYNSDSSNIGMTDDSDTFIKQNSNKSLNSLSSSTEGTQMPSSFQNVIDKNIDLPADKIINSTAVAVSDSCSQHTLTKTSIKSTYM